MKADTYANRQLIGNWIRGPRKHKHNNRILIAHLGNIDGRDEERENTPAYLQAALQAGYAVCCEVILQYGAFVLPCKRGYHPLPYALLSNPRVWFRAADAATLSALCDVSAHAIPASQLISLTSVHYLWCLPGTKLTDRSIAVYPELAENGWLESGDPAGLCSNEISRYL